MKPGDVVSTKFGLATIVRKEAGLDGRLERWLVRMHSLDGFAETYRKGLGEMQHKQGGLFLFRSEIDAAKSTGEDV